MENEVYSSGYITIAQTKSPVQGVCLSFIGGGDGGGHSPPPPPTFLGHCLQEKIKIL